MVKTFDEKGTFAAYNAAKKWLKENGYSYGSSCANAPTAIMKGDWCIAKWRNLTGDEIKQLDGKIVGEMREGPVVVHIKDRN